MGDQHRATCWSSCRLGTYVIVYHAKSAHHGYVICIRTCVSILFNVSALVHPFGLGETPMLTAAYALNGMGCDRPRKNAFHFMDFIC